MKRCGDLGLECFHTEVGDDDNFTCEGFREYIVPIWLHLGVTGIAMKPCSNWTFMNLFVDELQAQGVPIIFLDGDVPNSTRLAYVGTDQEFLGRTMARLLRKLKPAGGSYALIAKKDGRTDGFVEELERYNHREDRAHWYEVEGKYRDLNLTAEELQQQAPILQGYLGDMERAALLNPDALIFFKQSPMRVQNYTGFVEKHRHRNITLLGTDGADYQLQYLNQRYVDGLVGQLPYSFGTECAQALFDVITTGSLESATIHTNLVSYNINPHELPSLDVDQNLLDDVVFVGYVCFGTVVLSVLACLAWTIRYRAEMVARTAEPLFLYMVAMGVFILSSSLLPFSNDDGGDLSEETTAWSVGVCMSMPWLAFTGFTIAFSALLTKIWRMNRMLLAGEDFTPRGVSAVEFLAPLALLLSSNVMILTLWTIRDPLTYMRQEHEGTDYWNRPISTYGACRSDNTSAYLVPLLVINVAAICLAFAWETTDVQSEFGESKYISQAMVSLFQGFLSGIPIVVVVRHEPRAFYLVVTLMIFLLSMVLLWLVFLPKMLLQWNFSKMTPEDQANELRRYYLNFRKTGSYKDNVLSNSGKAEGANEASAIESSSVKPAQSLANKSTFGDSRLPVVSENDGHIDCATHAKPDRSVHKTIVPLYDDSTVGDRATEHATTKDPAVRDTLNLSLPANEESEGDYQVEDGMNAPRPLYEDSIVEVEEA